jgi:PAS domain S-box-containing protein
MQPTLRHKINGAILITFIVISLIFISIQLLLENRRSESVTKEIEVLLQMVVEREREAIASDVYQGLTRALTLRLDQIREKGNIFLISVFDQRGHLLVSRGSVPESPALSDPEIAALSNGSQIRHGNWQGVTSMVLMQQISVFGERVGFVRICYSLEAMRQAQRESIMILGVLLGAILVVMLILLNLIMSRTIVRPLLSLGDNMNRMQAGKYEAHVYRKSRDEIGALTDTFNKMAKDLAASYQNLDLKRTQLQAAQRYLSNIINSMPSILLGVDETLKVTQWNLQAERIAGITPESAIGKSLADVLPQLSDAAEVVSQALHEQATRKLENVQWEKDGKPVYMDITVYPLIDSGEQGAVIRVDDVTDRVRIQEALRESQEKYRLVVEYANDAILIIQDGAIVFANQNTETVSEYTSDELAGMPYLNCVAEEDRDLVSGNHADRIKGTAAPSNYSFRIRSKSGKRLWVNTSSVLISWNNRPATLNFLRDITDLKKTEEQLLHAQKMEAIGTLAGGIAHDFNNLLQVIQGYAQLLLFEKEDRKDPRRELEAILRAAKKGGELTTQLLTFGRRVDSHPKAVDLNGQIKKTKKMLSRTIPKMIDFKLNLSWMLPPVHVDPGQIEQVVMNLVINARDAMPDGGRILIETEAVTLDENSAKHHLLSSPGEYIRLSISDTGQGIPKEAQGHIFEPFFTTKKLGDGTGLGLAIVYGIVKNHNGSIQCHSVPEEGTTFSIFFPAGTPPGARPSVETPAPTLQIKGGTETVLLVDDEETLRDIGRQLLEKFGYMVLTAASAEEALEIYATREDPIHLVILDLVMPGMGGAKGIDALLELNPDTKIVVASGYFGSSKDVGMDVDLTKTKGYIKKPFVLETMLREVRRVLDTPSN